MKKLSLFLLALLAFGPMAWAQTKDPVSYIKRGWDDVNKVVTETTQTCTEYTELSGSHYGTKPIEAGQWYVVRSSFTCSHIIVCSGAAANLILCDGAALYAQITINDGCALNVFGQSSGTGKIVAESKELVGSNVIPPIGANNNTGEYVAGSVNMGTLTIHGGTIQATSIHGHAAAIGGFGIADGGNVNANGGTVIIYDGTITADATNLVFGYGAGIGGGHGAEGGTVTIYGGNVTAKGGSQGAGIGGGENGNGGTVTIYGGTVNATGGKDAAGIGSGEQTSGVKNGGTVTIHGGTVTARGGSHGAGIGGGQDASGATVVIDGGTVNAYGGTDAAGIGSGEEFSPGSGININGGSLTVTGGNVFADGTGWGAGIGGGEDADGATVEILGGTVTAWAGSDAGKKNGCAIGSEDGDNHRGTLYIDDLLMVHAGQNPSDANGHLFPKETRVPACFFRPYAKIEPCDHQGSSYSVSGTGLNDTHTLHCGHCKTNATHQHTFNAQHVCTVCGVNADTYIVNIYLPVINGDGSYTDGNYGAPITSIMVKDTKIVLPAAPLANEPRGMKFAGWLDEDVESGEDPIIPGTFITNSQESLTPDGVEYTIDEDTYLIARYNKVSLFNTSGNWNNSNNWYWHQVPTENDKVVIAANAIIPNGYTAKVGSDITIDLSGTITIKDGGQFINDVGVWATVEKSIAGHDGSAENGWHFIAQPTMDFFKPSLNNGFLTEDSTKYDLYYFHEPTHHWRNYKQGASSQDPHFYIEPDKGYLYANKAGSTLSMTGTIRPSNDDDGFTITGLSHSAEELTGFNLVGNPFACNATIDRPAYVISGREVVAYTGGTKVIAPCEGVMVQADAEHTSVTFTMTTESLSSQPGNSSLQVVLSQQNANTRGMEQIDNVIVSFKEGERLGKFYFGKQNANIYIPQGGEDYAIAFSEGQGEMPLNFKATQNGEYTITVNPENMEMGYLHLIDNLTGTDVDLLASPSYTFQAKTTDYASRFRLVFSANGNADGDEAFAFVNNGNIIVNGEGMLQIIDMTGRVIRVSRDAARHVSTTGMTPGVYVLRLINGDDVKTQKIVIE